MTQKIQYSLKILVNYKLTWQLLAQLVRALQNLKPKFREQKNWINQKVAFKIIPVQTLQLIVPWTTYKDSFTSKILFMALCNDFLYM